MTPDVHFARSGEIQIAYQVFGEGTIDLVVVPGWISNLDVYWEEPVVARFLQRLATFARVVLFDKRGTGLSDRVTDSPTLEERMDDVRAVLDAIGIERAALLGYSEGGPMCALFAATYPERTRALVMIGSYARATRADDYPYGRSESEWAALNRTIETQWGTPVGLDERVPSRASDPVFRRWWAKLLRSAASARTVLALNAMNAQIDVRHVLPVIRVPTLLLHAIGDRAISVETSRHMARCIPGARLVEYASDDHVPFGDAVGDVLHHVEEFLTGTSTPDDIDRVIATVMFTDLVGSTERASTLGDAAWRDLLEAHHRAVRDELAMYRGNEIKSTGDGFHATFDGPARAIRCARAIVAALARLELPVRVGIHTGECVVGGEAIEGLAVHLAARVADEAVAGEVLVSQTVKDLVAGAGFVFADRGTRRFKGIDGDWRVYGVSG